MDLGTILGAVGQIAQTYQTIKGPTPVMNLNGVGNWPTGAALPTTPALGLPFVDCIPEPPACDTKDYYWSTRANRGQGAWVKYRRRRKQLATKSDIAQLASLKTVLTAGDLKMWIATHS